MPGNAFIRFTKNDGTNVEGESLQSTHPSSKGWLEINDWSWDIESDTNFLKGTGAAVGKAKPGNLSFTHTYDKSSPVLLTNIVRGTHFKKVQIDMLKQVGDDSGKPAVYLRVVMGAAFVNKVASKGSEDGAITQDVEMVFKEIAVGYKRQNNDGTLDKEVKLFKWNVAQMNFTVSKDADLENLELN